MMMANRSANEEGFTDRFLKTLHGQFGQVGILSLSRRKDSSLMWAHYASEHRGFVLGFDEDNDFFKPTATSRNDIDRLIDVEYSSKRLSIDLSRPQIPIGLLYRKSLDWAYEQEVRVVRELSQSDAVVEVGSCSFSLFNFPKSAVVEVIAGARMSSDDIRRLNEAIDRSLSGLNVPRSRAALSRTAFAIDTVPL